MLLEGCFVTDSSQEKVAATQGRTTGQRGEHGHESLLWVLEGVGETRKQAEGGQVGMISGGSGHRACPLLPVQRISAGGW